MKLLRLFFCCVLIMAIANPTGANGPRPSRTTGRLRRTLANIVSKQRAFPQRLVARGEGMPGRPTALDVNDGLPRSPRPRPGSSGEANTGTQPPLPRSGGGGVEGIASERVAAAQERLKEILARRGGLREIPALDARLSTATVDGSMAGVLRSMAEAVALARSMRDRGEDFGSVSGRGGNPQANMALGKRLAAEMGWSGSEWAALKELWTRESGWRSNAANPTSSARGIPQAMMSAHFGSQWMENKAARRFLSNPRVQILWGLRYIRERYGSPSRALAHHTANNWY